MSVSIPNTRIVPKIIPVTKGSGLTKAERKAFYDQQIKEKEQIIEQNRITELRYFTDEQRATGELVKNIFKYIVGYSNFDIYFDREPHELPKEIPSGFPIRESDIFDNTWVIAIDIDETDMRVDIGGVMCIPNYTLASPETKAEFDRQIEAGARSNPRLMIYNKHDPTTVHSVRINIWCEPTSIDYWLRIKYRPNRIYLSDYDGFKIYDFELNQLYFKPISGDNVYGFKIDPENWNNVWVWDVDQARQVTGYYGYGGQEYNGICRDIYEDVDGIEHICEYIRT